jgi:Sec-independent protein translocase protein TatA
MYEIMFYAGMACFVLGCIVSIILFVKNDIAKAIGDVTGHNARKAMKKMQQERDEKEQSGAKKKKEKKQKEKRGFFGKMRDEKTSVLLNPAPPQTIIKPAEVQKEQAAVDFSNVFQVEEEMTVLGGQLVDAMPTTILSAGVSFGSKLDADLEADTNILKDRTTESHILPDGISALWNESDDDEETSVLRDDATDVLTAEDATDVLVTEDATDVLTTEGATDVLVTDDATDVLTTEDATDVLVTDDATDVLTTEDATDVLKTHVVTNKK